jgi:hypothetical protein
LKAEREAWREEFAAIDPARLVFVDETGASTAMDRTHGRAPSGVRVDGPVPHGHWKITTLTAAVRLDGVPTRPVWPSTGRPTRPPSTPTSANAWPPCYGPATSW